MTDVPYDGEERWGRLFRRLRGFETRESEAEDVEWVAKATFGTQTVEFVGYEDGPIGVDYVDHQTSKHTYVTDVIETEDAILVGFRDLARMFRMELEP